MAFMAIILGLGLLCTYFWSLGRALSFRFPGMGREQGGVACSWPAARA